MTKVAAEPYRDIDFSHATRGPVVPLAPGKTKISLRLDNAVLAYFRSLVEEAGGGNYQTLINDALVAYIQQHTLLDTVRLAIRQELQAASASHQPPPAVTQALPKQHAAHPASSGGHRPKAKTPRPAHRRGGSTGP